MVKEQTCIGCLFYGGVETKVWLLLLDEATSNVEVCKTMFGFLLLSIFTVGKA